MSAKGKKVIDSSFVIPRKRGNGIVRREVWVDCQGRVTRYNLAYINAKVFSGDNGRVLGYDNAHEFHHRHWYGEVTPVEFTSFENVEARFEGELIDLLEEARR
jgi:hypothetical protein